MPAALSWAKVSLGLRLHGYDAPARRAWPQPGCLWRRAAGGLFERTLARVWGRARSACASPGEIPLSRPRSPAGMASLGWLSWTKLDVMALSLYRSVLAMLVSILSTKAEIQCKYNLTVNFTLQGPFCSAGQYTNFPNTPCACVDCLPGTSQPSSAVPFNLSGMFEVCRECERGRHAMSAGSSECARCPENTFSPRSGWGEECLTCNPGEIPNRKRSSCDPCEPGTYWDGSSSCKLCLNGTVNPHPGGTLLNCTTCPSVMSNSERTVCLCDVDPEKAEHKCPDGWVCPGKSHLDRESVVLCIPAAVYDRDRITNSTV